MLPKDMEALVYTSLRHYARNAQRDIYTSPHKEAKRNDGFLVVAYILIVPRIEPQSNDAAVAAVPKLPDSVIRFKITTPWQTLDWEARNYTYPLQSHETRMRCIRLR